MLKINYDTCCCINCVISVQLIAYKLIKLLCNELGMLPEVATCVCFLSASVVASVVFFSWLLFAIYAIHTLLHACPNKNVLYLIWLYSVNIFYNVFETYSLFPFQWRTWHYLLKGHQSSGDYWTLHIFGEGQAVFNNKESIIFFTVIIYKFSLFLSLSTT